MCADFILLYSIVILAFVTTCLWKKQNLSLRLKLQHLTFCRSVIFGSLQKLHVEIYNTNHVGEVDRHIYQNSTKTLWLLQQLYPAITSLQSCRSEVRVMFNKPIRDDLSFKLVLEVVYDLKDLILAESKWDYQCLAELT